MLKPSEMDPPELISDFLASLPSAIRKLIASTVYLHVLRREVRADTDLLAELRSFLVGSESNPAFQFGKLLSVVAVIDFTLIKAHHLRPDRERALAERARKDRSFEVLAMRAPINSRHLDAAWDRWKTERESSQGRLGPASLHAYEKRLIEAGR